MEIDEIDFVTIALALAKEVVLAAMKAKKVEGISQEDLRICAVLLIEDRWKSLEQQEIRGRH